MTSPFSIVRLKKSLVALLFALPAAISGAAPAEDSELLDHFEFREIGPTRPGGRVVALAVAADDPYVFFVAAGPGGLWKTVNNGTTFEAVFTREAVASIGDVAIAPSDSKVVWVGSGEANLRNSTLYGNGVYRSLDGGMTWSHRGLEESHHIGRVCIDPRDPDTVYVAAQGHLYSENPERGVYKTTDGGATWVKSLEVEKDGRIIGAAEVVMDPTDPDILYAVAYDRRRYPWTFRVAGPGSGIYKTTDAGETWHRLDRGLPGGMLGKIGIAVSPQDPRILYATVDNQNSPGVSDEVRREELFSGTRPGQPTTGHGIYRSDDRGESWSLVSPEDLSIGSRSNYYGQIIVDPNDSEHLYVLGMRVWESRDGGKSWSFQIRYGGDNHVLWIDPRDSRHMLMGYDYGMAITHDQGASWYHPDELSMAQVYAVGVDMDHPYNVYCGMQDFGSWKGPSTKKGRFPIRFEDWEHVNGGDGFYNQVDPKDSRWLYSGAQFGHITRIDQKTGHRQTIVDDEAAPHRFNWNTPILISPHDSKVLYVGANVVLRSAHRGDQWDVVSPDLTRQEADKMEGVGAVQYATITTVDESPLEQGLLWVGTDDGNVQLSRDGGESWLDLTRGLQRVSGVDRYWISRVEASHHNPAVAYVSLTGFHRDDFRPFVFVTSDFGETWKSLGGTLPTGSVNVIQEDRKNPNLLFVGTDFGVFASLDRGASWSRMRNNLPTIAVHDLVVHPRENDLVVGTHGRGVFITNISPLQELSGEEGEREPYLFEVESQIQWVMPSQPAVSAQNFAGDNEPHGVVINYYLGTEAADVRLRFFDGDRLLHEMEGPGEAGLNRVEWGMVWRQERLAEDKEEWDREQEWIAEDVEFFDYYDTVDHYGGLDEEVDKWGRSLETRVHMPPGLTDRNVAYFRVPPGSYRVTLTVGLKVREREIEILEDIWYDD
jgi:photosystem II stability/assembly factor-like uncharacterized protein